MRAWLSLSPLTSRTLATLRGLCLMSVRNWVIVLTLLLASSASATLVDEDQDGTLRVCCLGDSNTAGIRWCEQAQRILPQLTVTNGVSSVLEPVEFINVASPGQSCVGNFNGLDDGGATQVTACATASPSGHPADVYIAAFVTNDVLTTSPLNTATDIKDCLVALKTSVSPKVFLAALGPPVISPATNFATTDSAVTAANAAITTAFGSDTVDFNTTITPCMYRVAQTTPKEMDNDGYHLNQFGQLTRAWRAVNVLLAH